MVLPKTSPHNVLIVSSAEKGAETISGLLDRGSYEPALTVHSGNEARRCMMAYGYDVVIINSPLSDESGQELAMDLSERSTSGVILIVKSELFEAVCSRVEGKRGTCGR